MGKFQVTLLNLPGYGYTLPNTPLILFSVMFDFITSLYHLGMHVESHHGLSGHLLSYSLRCTCHISVLMCFNLFSPYEQREEGGVLPDMLFCSPIISFISAVELVR